MKKKILSMLLGIMIITTLTIPSVFAAVGDSAAVTINVTDSTNTVVSNAIVKVTVTSSNAGTTSTTVHQGSTDASGNMVFNTIVGARCDIEVTGSMWNGGYDNVNNKVYATHNVIDGTNTVPVKLYYNASGTVGTLPNGYIMTNQWRDQATGVMMFNYIYANQNNGYQQSYEGYFDPYTGQAILSPYKDTQAKYTVKFDVQGGSLISDQQYKVGEKFIAPTNPTKDGYVFGGWYANSNLVERFNEDSIINEDKILCARWLETQETHDKNQGIDTTPDPVAPIVPKPPVTPTYPSTEVPQTGDTTANVFPIVAVILVAGVVLVSSKRKVQD